MTTEKASSYSNMAQNMVDEMEKRRKDWQKEVERMQQDFFKTVKLDPSDEHQVASPLPTMTSSPLPPSSTPSTYPRLEGIVNTVDGIQRLPDGTAVFRARFDVREYEPHEVSVRVVEVDDDGSGQRCNKLEVNARRIEDAGLPGHFVSERRSSISDANRRRTREFNRRVSIPSTVDIDRLVSRLAFDGLLTVEAPLLPIHGDMSGGYGCRGPPPQYETLTSASLALQDVSRDGREEPQRDRISTSSFSGNNSLQSPSPDSMTGGSRGYDIIEVGGFRLMKLAVDLGSTDFSSEDILVIVRADCRLGIVARREATSPITGKTTRRQFSRELDLKEKVDRLSVGAAFDADTGQLHIVAAVERDPNDPASYRRDAAFGSTATDTVRRVLLSVNRSPALRLCAVELR